jgi:hypothetical protein
LGPRRGRRLGQLCRHDTQTAKGDPSSDPHQITLNPEDTAFDIVGISDCTGFEAGEDLKVVSTRLGHAKTSTTADLYQHVSKRLDQQAANRVASFILGDQ